MPKARSSSSSSGAASTSSSSVTKNSKANKKPISSSKLVGTVISNISKQEVESSKRNPKTKEKWLAKLAMSIQKSVSVASSGLFSDGGAKDGRGATEDEANEIQKDIEKLEESIQDHINEVKAKTQTCGRKYETVKEAIAANDARTGKRSNQFEARVSRIADKFNQVANQVDTVGSDLKSRLKAFEQ